MRTLLQHLTVGVRKVRYCVISGKIRIKSILNTNEAMDILVSALKSSPESGSVTVSNSGEICYIFDKPGLLGLAGEISYGKFKYIKKKDSIYIQYILILFEFSWDLPCAKTGKLKQDQYRCCPRYFKIMTFVYVLIILGVFYKFFINTSITDLESKIILMFATIFFPPLMKYMISSFYIRDFLRKIYTDLV